MCGVAAALSTPFTTGWIFDVELIARFKNLRLRGNKAPCESVIYELPLESWHDIAGSKLDFFSKVPVAPPLPRVATWQHAVTCVEEDDRDRLRLSLSVYLTACAPGTPRVAWQIKALYGLGCIWCEYIGPMTSWNPLPPTPPPPQKPPPSPSPPPAAGAGEL